LRASENLLFCSGFRRPFVTLHNLISVDTRFAPYIQNGDGGEGYQASCRPILHTIHSPARLSHIGTNPPQAYPQITPPSPVGRQNPGPNPFSQGGRPGIAVDAAFPLRKAALHGSEWPQGIVKTEKIHANPPLQRFPQHKIRD
jgi:hypothetical protein